MVTKRRAEKKQWDKALLTIVSSSHSSKAISYKVRFWIIVRIAEYVCNSTEIRNHKPAASDETMVHE